MLGTSCINRRAWPLMVVAGAALLATGACSANWPLEEDASAPERARQVAENAAPRSGPPLGQYAERAGFQYWVQVGSHKDEGSGRAQWQKIQAEQNLLANVGNRIQRADLGARGIYYRVQVGPFASPEEAGQFCALLKARQVECFVSAPEATTAATPPEAAPRQAAPPAPRPAAKAAEPRPVAKPAAPKAAPAERAKDAAAAPKRPDAETPALPEQKPPTNASAEKPDAPLSTAPGLPGVLD